MDEMFKRYTILVEALTRRTSVYCDSCEEWIIEWDGEQVSRHTQDELYEKILLSHKDDFEAGAVAFE